MSHYYLDASAVVKRYHPESGSAWVKSLTDPATGHTLLLCEITLVEVAAAIAAKQWIARGITRKERDEAIALFLSHCDAEYGLIPVNRLIIGRAVSLTQVHKLRGYDAVQLATALVANESLSAAGLSPLVFVSADRDLVAAANTEGLAAEDPTLHP